MFILDKNAPNFYVTLPFYQTQLEKGLPLNILVNGEWHMEYEAILSADAEIGSVSRGNKYLR